MTIQFMFTKLLIIFISIPLIEMLILIKLGEVMGFWPTIWLVIGTGILGAALARVQGFRVWVGIQKELNAGRLPAEAMVDGVLIFAAGLVLLTPGLLTDILGFLLLIPPTRKIFKIWLGRKFEAALKNRTGTTITF